MAKCYNCGDYVTEWICECESVTYGKYPPEFCPECGFEWGDVWECQECFAYNTIDRYKGDKDSGDENSGFKIFIKF